MPISTAKGATFGAVLAALMTLYQFLPSFGLHIPTLPENIGPALGTVVGFIVGLFTKTPAETTP